MQVQNPTVRILSLKKDHPFHYWTRLFIVAYIVVNLTMVGLVRADTFPVGTGVEVADQPNCGYPGTAMASGARQLNGTLWHFSIEYTDATHRAVLANYSTDDGATWRGFEIIDETETAFGGVGFPYVVHDSVVLSNNSIIVLVDLYKYDTSTNHELHLLCHWNNSDLSQWEQVTVYSSGAYYPDFDFASMAVNSTDVILIAYERTAQTKLHHDRWVPSTRAFTRGEASTTCTSKWGPWALVNSTDVFIVAYPYNPGAGQKLYFKKESDWSAITDVSFGTGYGPSDCIVALDDTFVYTSIAHAGPGWFDVRYWNASGSGSRRVASTAMYSEGMLGLSNQTQSWILVMNYDYTNDDVLIWSQNYYVSSGMWQATQTIIFTETLDDIDYTAWFPHAHYPVLKDYQTGVENHTQIPLGGALLYFVDYDDPGYDFYCWFSGSTTWPGVPYWTYDPDWTAPGGPVTPGEETEGFSWLLPTSGCMSSWAILILLLVVAVGLVGLLGSSLR